MPRLICDISMSLDGFVAGPNPSLEHPLGEGGERLHEWAFPLASFRETHGIGDGGDTGPDDDASWLEEGSGETAQTRFRLPVIRVTVAEDGTLTSRCRRGYHYASQEPSRRPTQPDVFSRPPWQKVLRARERVRVALTVSDSSGLRRVGGRLRLLLPSLYGR